ncbi:RDD family protein [Cellulomonas shaoxiangyii]|uniref:RDD family protein n=1 Tax=Cellulomonas shaoxiangyii TaxID=2566013 RepID=A0A4P7SH78_9CELL|nr:RDD family protein [Cellulomonas shaoxiangyii]QCB93372.1 RDD family protein [Cellulomonas shaoxiangyii]TGY85334.1 RDD family protein [Cellulomonas shaoxiangyii]
MTTRDSRGSWLDGGPGAGDDRDGSGLGLPAEGAGSLARLPRRLAALAVDWVACLAVSAVLFPVAYDGLFLLRGHQLATVAVFAVENLVLVGTLGHTLGHRLLGMRVVPVGGAARGGGAVATGAPGLLRALVRSVLLCLVVPAVVWDADGRGMHDRAADTALVLR